MRARPARRSVGIVEWLPTLLLTTALVVGGTTVLWTVLGGVRMLGEDPDAEPTSPPPTVEQVAVVVAAHNEELVIRQTVRSAVRLVPAGNVFVVSDGSTDGTVEAATAEGATVLDLQPNRGKAAAIAAVLQEFELADRFEVVLLLDADTQLADDYFATGLPLFAASDVVAVAGRAATLFDPPPASRIGRLLVSYRERLYVAVQYLHKFGQASRWTNAIAIVPGFASMYRSRVLGEIDIAAAGLVIEDYNMTFEIHAKRLGRIAFHPNAAVARTQDPDTFHDYTRQVRRWSLGFWQTVRRHGLHRGRFWVALGVSIAELLLSSVLLVLWPVLLVAASGIAVAGAVDGVSGSAADEIGAWIPPWVLVAGLAIPDLVLSLLAAVVTRRWVFLRFAPLYPLIRMVDSALCLRALAAAFRGTADGRWRSPTRREAAQVSAATR